MNSPARRRWVRRRRRLSCTEGRQLRPAAPGWPWLALMAGPPRGDLAEPPGGHARDPFRWEAQLCPSGRLAPLALAAVNNAAGTSSRTLRWGAGATGLAEASRPGTYTPAESSAREYVNVCGTGRISAPPARADREGPSRRVPTGQCRQKGMNSSAWTDLAAAGQRGARASGAASPGPAPRRDGAGPCARLLPGGGRKRPGR